MPICNKPSLALSPAKSATDLNDHASEAAKMKRTREQAYFNSYNFDAIEQVLPYGHDMQEMEGKADGEEVGIKSVRTPTASNANTVSSCCSSVSNKQQQNPQQQQPQHNTLKTIYRGASSLTSSQSNPSSSRSSICESHPCDRCSNDSDCCLHQPHSSELTYAYMQRFGTLLMHSRNPSASSHFVEEDGVDGDVIAVESGNGTVGRAGGGGSTVVSVDVAPVHGKCETVASLKENFLLPRAMLKYQSVGNANSMPLAANCGGRADKLLQNGHNNRKHNGNSNKNNNNINNDDKNNNNNYNNNSSVTSSNNKYNSNNKSNNSGGKTIVMNTNAINNNNNNNKHIQRNNNISSINKSSSITNTNNTRATNKNNNNNNSHNSLSSHNSHTNSNNNNNNLPKNRQNYANNKDGYASLLVDTDINAIAPFRVTTTVKKTTTVAPAAVAVAVERPKHSLAATNSTPGAAVRVKKPSTSSTITTTTTESSASGERNDNRDHNDQDHDGHEKARSNGKGTTSNGSNTKLAQSIGSERRGRTNSHQSHYSTDKSGSSGYYSSNVCSTYSLDEHIYCEPVIDILDVSKSKSARLQTTTANTSDSKKSTTTKTLAKSHVHEMSHKGGAAPKRGGGAGGSGRRSNARATITNTKTTSRQGESGIAGCSEDVDGADECDEGEDEKEDGKDVPHIERGSKSKDATEGIPAGLQFLLQRQTSEESQHFSDNLRILETSIENLDRHLKQFPSLSSHERIAAFVQSHHHHPPHILQEHHHPQQQHAYLPPSNHTEASDKLASTRIPPHTQQHHHHAHHYLPTIMEGYDPTSQPHRSWPDEMVDDSLLDIDLDSFLLVNEKRKAGAGTKRNAKSQMRASGIDNPTFLTEEQEEENNLKCAQYINSCPDDAYRVESDIVAAGSASVCDTGTASEKSISLVDHYMKRYEDQMHFQSTRELLEDVRDKIRLLSQASGSAGSHSPAGEQEATHGGVQQLPHELEGMIKTLKKELENYLDRMNQHSELEIRQLCSGLVRNHNIVKMKKAFERRRSTHSLGTLESDYEAICDGVGGGGGGRGGVPTSIRDQIVSIRCASDPNFKMKRKSLTEVFPVADCYTEPTGLQRASSQKSQQHQRRASLTRRDRDLDLVVAEQGVYQRDQNMVTLHKPTTQLQRNLSFQQPVLNQIDAKSLATPANDAVVSDKRGVANSGGSSSAGVSNGSGAESGESGDKDSILEWHRKKPSIWEMYYGTNRMNQSLLGKRNALVSNNSTQVTMSYPSSRPESDFTLDLPRAEQLRIKMEKEKKFRQRCRYITTFLSLVFFLLTVMVVSLVLTRGKRMFGSMI